MSDETVLITGCSSGIGRETALTFLDRGWTVYATARNREDVADLGERGCETAQLDVTDPGEIENAVDRVIDEQRRLDCLVNNAGYGQLGAVEDVPPRKVREQFEVNVFGVHRLVREVLPHMREARDGVIVNVSSVAGRIAVPGMGVYCGSKAALEAMSDSLRREVSQHGVDVALVEPGPVDTGFEERATDSARGIERSGAYDEVYDYYEDRKAVDDVVTSDPQEVADAILHAATCSEPSARYPVGPLAGVVEWIRHLPAGWIDRAYGVLRRLA